MAKEIDHTLLSEICVRSLLGDNGIHLIDWPTEQAEEVVEVDFG